MIKSKVFEILKSFSPEEFKRFYDFVCSPYFNKKEALIKLTLVYKDQHPDFDNEEFTKENVFKFIFPDKKYNDEVFRNLNSDLMKLGESFLALDNFYESRFNEKKHLLTELNERKIFAVFDRAYFDANKLLENYGNEDIEYFQNKFFLFEEKVMCNSHLLNFSNADLNEQNKHLLTFFLLKFMETMTYICYHCRNQEIERSLIVDIEFIQSMINNIPREISNLPQVQISFNELMLEITQNKIYYMKLKELLKKFGVLFRKINLYTKYTYLINYVQTNYPTNDIETNIELFELRRYVLEEKLYPESFVNHIFYLNQVKAGLILKKYNDVHELIHKYHPLVMPEHRDNIKELALALYFFEKEELENSLKHLSGVKYGDIFLNLHIKNLYARIYFEMADFTSVINVINSYKMYLVTSKKVRDKLLESHSMFISVLSKLTRIKEQQKFSKLIDLEVEVKKIDFVSKLWVLKTIAKLFQEEESLRTRKQKNPLRS